MASKGQKFRKYSQETIDKILEDHNNNCMPSSILTKKYNIPVKTIKNWIYKYNHSERFLGLGQKRGRPKESGLTKEDYKERYEILKKYQAFLKAQRERK
jgi:transposase